MKIKYRFWGTSLEGTRQVFTYIEILTDDTIEEYLNDELIDSRPNILGIVPVDPHRRTSRCRAHRGDCRTVRTSSRSTVSTTRSPPSVADIINYHAEPITIITGAKASQLERGAKKIWAGLPKDARVENLEGGYQGLKQGLEYMELLKRTMHEMVGIPETALGQVTAHLQHLRCGAEHPVPAADERLVAAEDPAVRARDRADQRVDHPDAGGQGAQRPDLEWESTPPWSRTTFRNWTARIQLTYYTEVESSRRHCRWTS